MSGPHERGTGPVTALVETTLEPVTLWLHEIEETFPIFLDFIGGIPSQSAGSSSGVVPLSTMK